MAEVTLRRIVKRFGTVEVVHGVDLDIANNEFLVLVGPSGCGKSTLLRIVAGLDEATAGEVRIDGRPVRGPVANVGVVFQRDLLLDWRRVLDNVLLPAELQKLDRATAVARAH